MSEKDQEITDEDQVQMSTIYIPSEYMKKWIKRGMKEDFGIESKFIDKAPASGAGNKVYFMPDAKPLGGRDAIN